MGLSTTNLWQNLLYYICINLTPYAYSQSHTTRGLPYLVFHNLKFILYLSATVITSADHTMYLIVILMLILIQWMFWTRLNRSFLAGKIEIRVTLKLCMLKIKPGGF